MRSAEGDAHRAEVARAYMRHVRGLHLALRRLQDEIDAARSTMSLSGIRYDPMPKSPNPYGDAIPDGYIRVQDLIAAYATEQAECVEEQSRAHEALRMIADERGRYVLTAHYLLGRTWGEVAFETGYSRDYVKELARAALTELFDFLPPGWREPRYPAI